MDGICVCEFQRVTRTEFNTLRISVAEIALKYLLKSRMIRDVAERACVLAHLAAYALVVVDDNSVVVIASDGFNRTYFHA